MAEGAAGPRVSLRRSGGLFAGNTVDVSLSPDELDAAGAAELRAALDRADLPALAQQSPLSGPGADTYQYDLTVADAGGEHAVTVSGRTLPEELRPLVTLLEQHALKRKD